MSTPEQTIARLRGLRLHAMADAYQLQLDQPNLHDLPFDDRFGLIVEHAAHASQFVSNLPVAFRGGRIGESLWPVLSGPMLFIS